MLSTKFFALFFVLCFAVGSLAQLEDDDQVIVYDQATLPTSGNVSFWENSAAGAAGTGDLTLAGGSIIIDTCSTLFSAPFFDGASYLSSSFPAIGIDSTDTVVITAVLKTENGGLGGRQGVLSTSSDNTIPWTEGSVGPGIFNTGDEYYEDAVSANPGVNVAGTNGLTGSLVALGFVYTPNADDTTDDYVVINGQAIQFFEEVGTSVDTSAVTTVTVGFRAAGSDINQHFTGCVYYLSVYIISSPVSSIDVAETVALLAARFDITSGTPTNSTVIPSPSPRSRTTTTGRQATTTGRQATTTTGRKGTTTTGRRTGKTSTTGVSAASLPSVAPSIQALFLGLVSAFLFFMW